MKSPLLRTKTYFPPDNPDLIIRQRLLNKLIEGQSNKSLTLVSAPAGYGKTTLVTEWLRSIAGKMWRVAWFSIDEADNDPVQFMQYLSTSLCQADDKLDLSILSLLEMPQTPSIHSIMLELVNDLADLDYQLIIVFDDYHVITYPEIHDALENFIKYQPGQVHTVLTTRSDPPWSLARLRARNQMTEIRASDLRFTPAETQEFFNKKMKLGLEMEMINTLETRTEGWVAGLQLAALAMKNLPEPDNFLTDFSGSHRYVIDYLVDEVLKSQPLEIQEFLYQTSVLQQFNANLCQAVTRNRAAKQILEHLEHSNLFLISLDDQRGWYRYHHLFADVLRAGLSSEGEYEIHRLAATWFEENGFYAEAIGHWLAVSDPSEAGRLVKAHADELLKNGELRTLLGWLKILPEQTLREDPDLFAFSALSLLLTEQIDQAQLLIQYLQQDDGVKISKKVHGRLLAVQAWLSMVTGGMQTGETASQALLELEQTETFFRLLALIPLGHHYAWSDELPTSSKIFREAYYLGSQLNQSAMELGALANLAFNLLEQGQLREAESLCRSAFSNHLNKKGIHLPILGIIYSPMAAICYEKGDFEEAETFAHKGIDLAQRLFSKIILGGDSEIVLARIAYEQGDVDKAFNILYETAQTARLRKVMMVVYKMEIVRVELHLSENNLLEAKKLLDYLEMNIESPLPKLKTVLLQLRARYLIAAEQPEKALEILTQLEESHRSGARDRRLIGVQITQALAYQALGDQSSAREVFETALSLAFPQGYQTVFYPHPGRKTQVLLRAAQSSFPQFVDGILEKCTPLEKIEQPILDPLSEQELNVLALIAVGKTNKEIAEELFISVGTAKWHVHNILQKLEVENRTTAITRASELGIL